MNPEVCKVCKFMTKDSHYDGEGGYVHVWLLCTCQDSSTDAYYAKWKFEPTPQPLAVYQEEPSQNPIQYKYNEGFKVPDRCPYVLEHTVSQ